MKPSQFLPGSPERNVHSFVKSLLVVSVGLSSILEVSGYTVYRSRVDGFSDNETGAIDVFGHPRRFSNTVEKRTESEKDERPGYSKWVDSFGQIKYVKTDSFHRITARNNDGEASGLPNIIIKEAEQRGYLAHSTKHIFLPRNKPTWQDLKREVVISRDCGRAGVLGGRRFFVFCDTEVQCLPKPDRPTDQPYMVSFSANSFAYDYSQGIEKDKAIILQETGMYDDVGRLSSWVQLHKSESDFNGDQERKKREGASKKERLAVWFESGPAILSNHRAVQFAPIVKVIAEAGKGYQYEYLGNTLVNITFSADKRVAPRAERPQQIFFSEKEMNFGSFGSAYFGGKYLYVMAPSQRSAKDGGGIMFGRVETSKVTDKKQYRFWNGKNWEAKMPNGLTHADKAVVIPGSFSRGDIIFSRLHGTFLFIYMNGKVDSTFYYRKLLVPNPIKAPFPSVPLDSSEWDSLAEHLFKHPWSSTDEVLLKTIPHLSNEYNYAGSIATGYFGDQDISNGGSKLLFTWTTRSGQRAWEKPSGEYHHGVGYVEFMKEATSGVNMP